MKEPKYKLQSIGKEKAIALAKTEWWVDRSAYAAAKFQLFTRELCMPLEKFHEALEIALGRPVYTHELGLDYDGLCMEFLGEKDPPTMQEIIDLIPEDKRILIQL